MDRRWLHLVRPRRRAVAKRAAPFGLRMMAYDPFIAETLISDHGVLPATLSEVLSQSDFVSMHAPARPEVHHMLGENHFKQMKKSAIFINTGRGPTVNEEALIKALQEGWIAHAALDVLEKETRPRTTTRCSAWRTSR